MSRQIAETERWIWPFELLELIGHGGMGEVYRARTVNTRREVALKLLPTDMASNKMVVERFKREMTVLKNLKHPNIVTCYGGTCKGNRYYYAMELVTGGSLERLIQKRERLSWKQAAGFMLKLCAALECAHKQGIVHRDIKPANLLLTRKGQLKLADFGLAHMTADTKLTAAGMALGTYYYMSPEQIRGKGTIDCRTDLYAVGCVFFEMLTGRHRLLAKLRPKYSTNI